MSKVIFTEEHEALVLHYNLLVRQLARLFDAILHIIRLHTRATCQNYQSFRNGYKAFAQTEIADIIHQSKKILEILDLSFEETVQMGHERYEEKKREFIKRYPNDKWI
ncbi:MAG: hypothetical protein COZ28_01670 [Candidatus Moranbacteria bacterium CG_4_10_14_3_um_filter_44_15]|nr:MAG: hypothetical protein COZ28_01670 [Candidatus Moranbacteria bacterium CG_4_10_14_3_um_filter_44_15]